MILKRPKILNSTCSKEGCCRASSLTPASCNPALQDTLSWRHRSGRLSQWPGWRQRSQCSSAHLLWLRRTEKNRQVTRRCFFAITGQWDGKKTRRLLGKHESSNPLNKETVCLQLKQIHVFATVKISKSAHWRERSVIFRCVNHTLQQPLAQLTTCSEQQLGKYSKNRPFAGHG